MKLTSQDFKKLRSALVVFAILVGGGIAAVIISTRMSSGAAAGHAKILAQRDDIQSRLSRANIEESEIRQKIGQYQDMVQRGYIGQEHRLEWVERIAQIKTARRLIDIQYELSPQSILDSKILPGGGSAGGYEFMASTMRLQMQLLHEDDLLGFFSDLDGSVKAFLHARECLIDRLPKATSERIVAPQLRAECTVDWITLREKS